MRDVVVNWSIDSYQQESENGVEVQQGGVEGRMQVPDSNLMLP
jgi:hypothetical protein